MSRAAALTATLVAAHGVRARHRLRTLRLVQRHGSGELQVVRIGADARAAAAGGPVLVAGSRSPARSPDRSPDLALRRRPAQAPKATVGHGRRGPAAVATDQRSSCPRRRIGGIVVRRVRRPRLGAHARGGPCRVRPVSGGAHGSSQELRLPVVLDARAHGAQVLRSVRRGRAARDPQRAHAVLRAAADPRQGEAHPHPRRGRRGAQLPAQRRAAHRRAQRPARLPGRPVRLAEAREPLLPRRQARRARRRLAQRRLLARARHASTSAAAITSSPASSSSASTARRKANDGPAPDGTYFYSSPKHQSPFRIDADPPGRRGRDGGLRARATRSRSGARAAT